jgi:aminomethyltransferase
MSETVRSVLHDVQEAAGATFRDDDGWFWTMSFGASEAQRGYSAMIGGATAWDVYPLVKWDVTGPQATEAIQRVFTQDVMLQQPGQVKYGGFVDEDGLLVDDGTVFKHADDHYWVLTNTTGFGDFWSGHRQGLDVVVVNRVHEMPLISVQGPTSRSLVQSLTETDLSGLGYFRFRTARVEVAGVPAWVTRTGFSGEQGYELIPDRSGAVELWTALLAAGAVPVGLDTIEPTRIEAGLIIYGTDYTPGEHTPYDVSMDRFVALDTADFLGRRALAEVAARPPRRLRTLRIEGSDLPDVGAEVRSGGSVVGTISSRVDSPRYGVIGLAMLDTANAGIGEALEVSAAAASGGSGGSGSPVKATVAELGVKDPAKLLPRG